MLCKSYSLKDASNTKKGDFERGAKPRAGEGVGIQKKGFNSTSPIDVHKEAAIETQRPRFVLTGVVVTTRTLRRTLV